MQTRALFTERRNRSNEIVYNVVICLSLFPFRVDPNIETQINLFVLLVINNREHDKYIYINESTAIMERFFKIHQKRVQFSVGDNIRRFCFPSEMKELNYSRILVDINDVNDNLQIEDAEHRNDVPLKDNFRKASCLFRFCSSRFNYGIRKKINCLRSLFRRTFTRYISELQPQL